MKAGISPKTVALVLLLASPLAACFKDFDPPSLLGEEIQVLAVRASPPGVRQGETVRFDSLVYVPQDWPNALESIWFTCIPEVGESAQVCLQTVFTELAMPMQDCQQSCAQDADPEGCMEICMMERMMDLVCDSERIQKGCLAGYGSAANYLVPYGSFPDDGEDHSFFVFMMATAMPGGLYGCFDRWQAQISQGEPIAPDTECTLSLKRVSVPAPDTELTSNPGLVELMAEDQAIPDSPDALSLTLVEPDPSDNKLDLSVTLDATTQEIAGEVFLSWYADCGKLKRARTFGDDPVNTLVPEREGICLLYVVVRDGENGVGFIEGRLVLEVP